MLSTYLLFCIAFLKATHSQSSYCSSSSGTCTMRCDGNPYCRNKNIVCPANRDCVVDCYYSDSRRLLSQSTIDHTNQHRQNRVLLSVYTCPSFSDFYGCCNSNITCPSGQDCEVDCKRGCNGVTIHAEDSNSLLVSNCDQYTSNQNYCGNMNIYCPRNGREGATATCQIEGGSTSYEIESSNIYTEEGFNDVYFDTLHTSNTRVYCGKTGIEHSCIVASDGDGCASGQPTLCETFIVPTSEPTRAPSRTPTPAPTSPTNDPTHSPTNDPTTIPTTDPTNDPTTDPTFDPTKSPTIDPTHNPTMTPITNAPTINPTTAPTMRPTTPLPTLHIDGDTSKSPTSGPTRASSTTIGRTETGPTVQSFWQSTVGFDLEVILIALCAVLMMCCICLFICYWCRKESIYRKMRIEDRERSEHLSSPLLGDDAIINEGKVKGKNLVEMQDYDAISIPSYKKNNDILSNDGGQNSIFNQTRRDSDGESICDDDEDDDDLELGDMVNTGAINTGSDDPANEHIEGKGYHDDENIIHEIERQVTKGGDDNDNGVKHDEFVIDADNDSDYNAATPHGNDNNIALKNDENVDKNKSHFDLTQGFIE